QSPRAQLVVELARGGGEITERPELGAGVAGASDSVEDFTERRVGPVRLVDAPAHRSVADAHHQGILRKVGMDRRRQQPWGASQHPSFAPRTARAGGFTSPERAGGLGGAAQHPPALITKN